MIEQAIYQLLSNHAALVALTEGRIYPTIPTENAQLPAVVFSISSSEPQLTTTGVSSLMKYTVELDMWGVNLEETLQVSNEVKNCLHGYRGGNFQGIFLQTKSLQQEEDGYHESQSYTAWANGINITATSDSTGQVRTLSNAVELNACGNILRLDCDGLKLNDEAVGETPDLTPYARKDQPNTFTLGQNIQGNLAVQNFQMPGLTTNTSNVRLHLTTQSTTQTGLRIQRPSGQTAPVLEMVDHFGTLMCHFNANGAWYQSQNTSIGDVTQPGVHIGQTGGSNTIVLSRGGGFSRWFTDVTTDFGGVSRYRVHTGGGQGFNIERAGNGTGEFRFGFFGDSPVARQALPTALSGSATLSDVITAFNSLRTAMITSTLFQ
jgi:hypothetical protein